MQNDARPSHIALRLFLTVDATLLLALGLALIIVPEKAQLAFHFQGLPSPVNYMIGLLGCVFVSLGIGHGIAATDPVRHVSWVIAGFARAAIEVVFGTVCVARSIVTWQQASFGIIVAAVVAAGYALLYPRKSR